MKAFVVPVSGATIELVGLRDFVAERVAAFKVPRFVELVDELPHTPTGRIAKHELPRDRTPEEHDFDPELTGKSESS